MFRFKQFSVNDENSTMKVGTDALLVSALSPVPEKGNILDIGTGCGVIALLMAQQSNCLIDAIDVDVLSIIEAKENFAASAWNERLSAIQTSLQNYSFRCKKRYELIISNPPFFLKSLKGENSRRNLARHNDSLCLQDLFNGAQNLISDEGTFSIILPTDLYYAATSVASQNGFHLNNLIKVVTRERKQATRAVMLFSNKNTSMITGELTISNAEDKYTDEYRHLMKPYLTIFI
jgi:tRNA1Val (adenine37-N6)-methyltransferase